MASSSLLNPPLSLRLSSPRPFPSSSSPAPFPTTTCGPRDNRGPLQRGRTLSSEAIFAVQSLKRASASSSATSSLAAADVTLRRLLKSDLLAALAELQRQGQWHLALKVFSFARQEPWYNPADFALYAEMAAAMARCGAGDQVDALVDEMLEEKERSGGFSPKDDVWKLTRLIRVLIAAGRGEAVRRVYEGMRKGGCVGDEYLFRVLMNGLRKLGELKAADVVQRDFKVWDEGGEVKGPLTV
ncbi:protein THYLAKOID ASSEMBLY 8, chloroplastic [Typha angustifolia]|uniref:protein THYLAKOID ASSEMBLY 8, chloroplastic n=1 Tax=Typha angustifolia TaxID=59011 RepID=UPI003C2F64DD